MKCQAAYVLQSAVAKKVLGEIVERVSNTVMITAKEKERIKCVEISGIGFSKIKGVM